MYQLGDKQMTQECERTINVMLVDDHKCILWGLEKLIENQHPRMHVVAKAHNRAEAIAGARDILPDVILLDLDLNGESSLDFLPELRKNDDVHVLVLTGNRDSSMRERAVLLGASGVVLKDVAAETLIKAVECVHEGELWLDRVTTGKVFNAFANGNSAQNPNTRKISSLTPKEREIVSVVVGERGAKSETIAEKLHMSEHTLRNHLTSVYAKLSVRNRVELVMYAMEHNLAPATETAAN
jgi:DNA-binding NarL/FixJ family response regulator